jgi:sec-independent protein translocase protein TatA
MAGLKPQELLIILVILLVLFGGAKLPQLARNLGRAQKEFKDGIAEGNGSSKDEDSRLIGNSSVPPGVGSTDRVG